MKFTKYAAIPLSYAICLVLLANEAQAKGKVFEKEWKVVNHFINTGFIIASTTQQVEDISKWTQDQVQAYFDKYNIVYDKNDENLLDTAKRYRDAAVANANIFIADKSDSVTRLIEGLKIKLEKQYNLAANAIDGFTTDLSHELKQLELSGHLTQDRVKQTLDQYQAKAIKQKYVTEAQWKDIANDIQGSFVNPTWYQRLFGTGPTHSSFFDEDSFHTWVSTSLTDRVKQNKELTKQEIDDVVQTLKRAIQSTSSSVQDLSKLASADWWKQLGDDLEKDAKLKKNQVDSVIESLKDDVNSYKIFAMDYAGQKVDDTQSLLASAVQYVMDRGQGLYQAVVRPAQRKQSEIHNAATATASSLRAGATEAYHDAKDSFYDAKEDVAESVEDVKEYVDDTKDSFGKFWRNKELETYRKIGYTEAHINWLESYLSKTFHNKAEITKESIQHAIQTIRNYLIKAKVQTAANIDAQLKSLEGLLNSWRHSKSRTEL